MRRGIKLLCPCQVGALPGLSIANRSPVRLVVLADLLHLVGLVRFLVAAAEEQGPGQRGDAGWRLGKVGRVREDSPEVGAMGGADEECIGSGCHVSAFHRRERVWRVGQ